MAVETENTKKLTRDEFYAIANLPENAEKILELVDGEIVEKMVSYVPSVIAINIATELKLFVRGTALGTITGVDGCYDMPNGDMLCPDVAFIVKARLTEVPTREAPVPPYLAVEIKSPTDTYIGTRQKTEKYLAMGVRLVWLVFPEKQFVEVYAPGQDSDMLGINDELSGGAVLPGFKLNVRDVFLL